MASLLEYLNRAAFTLWGSPMSWAEVLGFVTGLACVWLAARRHILNFPVGIANCALLCLLFWQSRLFADAGLQLVFIALGLQGWWLWARAGAAGAVPVSRLAGGALAATVAAGLGGLLGLYGLLTWAKGSVPVADACITSFSLVAQWLLNRRKLETWYFWMVVDVVSIPLYAYKGLYLIALLYVVFLGLCVLGWRAWRAELRAQSTASA